MKYLPPAHELPDGSLVVPQATRELLHRVLGDVLSTLLWTNGMTRSEPPGEILDVNAGRTLHEHGGPVVLDHSHEIAAIGALRQLLGPAGRLPPLHEILGTEPPPFKPPEDDPTPPPAGEPTLRRVK